MESLAALVAVILFSSLIGGPTALLLTWLPDQPRAVRILRKIFVVVLSLLGIIFGGQLSIGSSIPLMARLIGFVGLTTSVAAVLFEFKIIKRKSKSSISSIIDSSGTNKKYAVIFRSKRQDANHELYYQHDGKLEEKIKSLPGYINHFGIRHPETRAGVTVAYFDSLDAIDSWRKDAEHMDAKKLAKSDFYENYSVEITEVIDQYGWDGN
jgi:heme-degrading monooxygenase HmoA